MLAVQLSPLSLSSFPHLIPTSPIDTPAYTPRRLPYGMPTSPPITSPPSVFNVLGSYADRIKDANGKPISVNGLSSGPSPSASQSKPLPAAASSSSNMPSSSSSSSQRNVVKTAPKVETKDEKQTKVEEDAPWETVQSSRQKPRPANGNHTGGEDKRSAANASRNWRERPIKDVKENKEEDEVKRPSSRAKKSAPSASTSTAEKEKEKSTSTSKPPVTAPSSSKPAWGVIPATQPVKLGNQTAQLPRSVSATDNSARPTKSNDTSGKPSHTVPSSPSVSGTTTTTSVASPNPSAGTGSTVTAATSVTTKVGEDEESWRSAGAKDAPKEIVEVKETPIVRPTAPPPSVNAWDLRKKNLSNNAPVPTSSSPASQGPKVGQSASQSTPSSSSTQGTISSPAPNGDSKSSEASKSSKKKKKPTSEPAVTADPTSWPDVVQAAEVAKKEEEKKEALKAKKESEEGSVVDEATAGKKQKWKAIPAAELQAAADIQAEATKRITAAKKRVGKVEPNANAIPPKVKPRNKSVDPVRGQQLPNGVNGHGEPSRAQSQHGQAARVPPIKSAFASMPASSDAGSQFGGSQTARRTSGSTPMSRQTSSQSRTSATGPSTHLASPAKSDSHLDKMPNGPSSKPMTSTLSAGATAPPTSYNHLNGNGFPRGGRGRNGRQSFSGPARAYRGPHSGIKGYTSPNAVLQGLPADNAYSRGFGMGFNTFYPAGTNAAQMASMSQVAQYGQGVYDPAQVQYSQQYSRSNAPPPPMPQTNVPGIDPQRFYVLGQVEYYFSMQNLAMDFFLRQQMDSAGWIDITMIASFNRLKSLTPDIAMVKEVMHLSSLLEVREEKVRLAGQESNRWVLPDAKPSTFPPDPETDPSAIIASTPGRDSHTQSLSDQEISELALGVSGLAGLGMEDLNGGGLTMPKYAPGDVENALMKSSAAPSSSASVGVGEEVLGGTVTPGTSTSGDVEAEKVELR